MAETGALDRLMRLPGERVAGEGAMLTVLATASAAIGRLDQALINHPLLPAFLHRARLDAVRKQAAVDGALIDPWHLAAILEGLRLRMDPNLRIIERGLIHDAARTALILHQWLVDPDFDQEGEIQRAMAMLTAQPKTLPPLLAAARGFREWIEQGEGRAPIRAALVRFWIRQHLLRHPVPLTGAAALRAEQSWIPEDWLPAFLDAIGREAADNLDLLHALERAWFTARRNLTDRRKSSHAAAAVDLLAATPVISATTLARILGIAVKNALRILDELCAAEIAIEVTHRSRRRLFGLAGLTPLRAVVRPPYRPVPGRGPGRPRIERVDPVIAPPDTPLLQPLSPLERRDFDYTALEAAMAELDTVIRQTRVNLSTKAAGTAPQEAGTTAPEPSTGMGKD